MKIGEDYDNFSLFIGFGCDFDVEKHCLWNKILPKINSKCLKKKCISIDFQNIVCRQPLDVVLSSNNFKDSMLVNLDFIKDNGSIAICVLGEILDDEIDDDNFRKFLLESIEMARDSGHIFLDEINLSIISITEILAIYLGLMSQIKYPLFYFRVSGGKLNSEDTSGSIQQGGYLDNPNPQMEKLRKKLIRSGVSIQFYGSEKEFVKIVEEDISKILEKYPERNEDTDDFLIDQNCFIESLTKSYHYNDLIHEVFSQLDMFYMRLSKYNWDEPQSTDPLHLNDFYRKEFSEKLNLAVTNMQKRLNTKESWSIDSSKLLILQGTRGSGKSALVANWVKCKTDDEVLKIIIFGQASYDSTDLRIVLKTIINKIHVYCGYKRQQNFTEILTLESEVLSLGQQLEGAFLLCQSHRKKVLLIIDGIDFIGDKCATASSKIKDMSWFPNHIPANVRVIVTCSTSDSCISSLYSKSLEHYSLDLNRISPSVKSSMSINHDTNSEYEDESYDEDYSNGDEDQEEDIQHTEEKDEDFLNQSLVRSNPSMKAFIDQLNKFNQKFVCPTIDKFSNWTLISNPLVQRIMARSYHCLHICQLWPEFISKIHECQSLVQLMRRLMLIWVSLLNWEVISSNEKTQLKQKKITFRRQSSSSKSNDPVLDKPNDVEGWLPDCLSLIAMSTEGISMADLLNCLKRLGYTYDYEVRPDDIWTLFHYSRGFLLNYHNNRFVMLKNICKDIVEHTFLAIATCSSVEARSMENTDYIMLDRRCKLHMLLASIHLTTRSISSNSTNLIHGCYHLYLASDYGSLSNLICSNAHTMLALFNVDLDIEKPRQMILPHRFLYYWHTIDRQQRYDCLGQLERLVDRYTGDNSFHELPSVDLTSSDHENSEFLRKIKIQLSKFKFTDIDPELPDHALPFAVFLARVCTLLNFHHLAEKLLIFVDQSKYLASMPSLKCQVLWQLVTLYGDKLNDTDMSHSVANELVSYLSDNPHVSNCKYLLCACLSYILLHHPSSNDNGLLIELLNQNIGDINSVELRSSLSAIQVKHRLEDRKRKTQEIIRSILTLEMWCGQIHSSMADKLVILADIMKSGNYTSRLKAEACCRRALWIWKQLDNTASASLSSDQHRYHEMINTCRELLFHLLFKDQSVSSMEEASHYLASTYDDRVIHLGSNHPTTRQIMPLIKLANIYRSSKIDDYQYRQLQAHPTVNTNQNHSNSIGQLNKRCKSASPNLNAIYKYLKKSPNDDNEDEDPIDLSIFGNSQVNSTENPPMIAVVSRPPSSSLAVSISQLKRSIRPPSAASVINRARTPGIDSQHHISTPILRTSIASPLVDNQLKHIYLHNNSSLSYLIIPRPMASGVYSHSRPPSSNKQVRFISADQNWIRHNRIQSSRIQKKNSPIDRSVTPSSDVKTKRIHSANFSRPYKSVIDPLA